MLHLYLTMSLWTTFISLWPPFLYTNPVTKLQRRYLRRRHGSDFDTITTDDTSFTNPTTNPTLAPGPQTVRDPTVTLNFLTFLCTDVHDPSQDPPLFGLLNSLLFPCSDHVTLAFQSPEGAQSPGPLNRHCVSPTKDPRYTTVTSSSSFTLQRMYVSYLTYTYPQPPSLPSHLVPFVTSPKVLNPRPPKVEVVWT